MPDGVTNLSTGDRAAAGGPPALLALAPRENPMRLPGPAAITPQAPTRPAEAPAETPSRPADRPDPDAPDPDADLDDELERIIREIPDPTPQPGGE